MGIVIGVISGIYLCMTVKYLKIIILVPDFCPLKPEIARIPIGFRLNNPSVYQGIYKKSYNGTAEKDMET